MKFVVEVVITVEGTPSKQDIRTLVAAALEPAIHEVLAAGVSIARIHVRKTHVRSVDVD